MNRERFRATLGSGAIKALALGASTVQIGRPQVYRAAGSTSRSFRDGKRLLSENVTSAITYGVAF